MHMEYRIDLILFSILIAILGCAAALYLLRGINNLIPSYRKLRILLAAFVFATGTWAMHFIGMLSMKMPMSLTYDTAITATSYFCVVAGSIPAMVIISNKSQTVFHRFVAAICLSISICVMHFSGMNSLAIHPSYQASWVIASMLAAFIASYSVLWVCQLWKNQYEQAHLSFIVNSIIMGVAVSSMHYIGMMTTHFNAPDFSIILNEGLNQERMAYLTGTLTVTFLLNIGI